MDDFIIGCVSQAGDQGFNIARNAWLSAGLPESVPGVTLDRQCGSSIQSLQFAANGIRSGQYDVAMAGGVESMTRVPMGSTINSTGNPITFGLTLRYGIENEWFSQAKGAEIIANKWHIDRSEMDMFALSNSLCVTGIGPVSIVTGFTPTAAVSIILALGLRLFLLQ